jgi:hypothetical protein
MKHIYLLFVCYIFVVLTVFHKYQFSNNILLHIIYILFPRVIVYYHAEPGASTKVTSIIIVHACIDHAFVLVFLT